MRESDIVGAYQSALAAGDVDAAVAAFDPDGYAREPSGGAHVHADLRAFYEWLFSNGGGIPLEHCAVIDDGRACALEYNVVQWGRTELPPQAGIGVYVRGESGKLVAARVYDDADRRSPDDAGRDHHRRVAGDRRRAPGALPRRRLRGCRHRAFDRRRRRVRLPHRAG